MQRCLSGLRSTIGNRVMQECIRRFKSSSLRHKKPRKTGFFACFRAFLAHFALSPFVGESVIFYPFFAFTPPFTPLFLLKKALIPFIYKPFLLFALPHFLLQNDAFFIISAFFRRRRRLLRACITRILRYIQIYSCLLCKHYGTNRYTFRQNHTTKV